MNPRLILLAVALLSACRLSDKFRGASNDKFDDMALPADDGDMASPPSSDLADQQADDMAQHTPQWTRHAMEATTGGFYGPGLIWGSRATDLYTVALDTSTNQASIWHSTDAVHWTEQWSAGTGSSPPTIVSMWGSSPHDIYAVGARALLHSTGDGTWRDIMFALPSGITASSLSTVWGSGLNDVYVAPVTRTSDNKSGILHFGQTASFQQNTIDLTQTIWGSSATDIFASGAIFYSIAHSIGDGAWQKQGTPTPSVVIQSIWGSGPNDIYAGGNTPNGATDATNAIYHSTGNGTWTNQVQNTTSLGIGHFIHVVYGTGPRDIYAAAPLMHSTGDGNWTNVNIVNSMNDSIGGIWAASSSDVFVTAAATDGISSPIIWIYE